MAFGSSLSLVLVAVFSVTVAVVQCAPNINGRIVGGIDAAQHQLPYAASLRWGDEHHFCGATIVRPRWVVSSAHCTTGFSEDEIEVHVGSHLLHSGGYEYRSVRVVNHPDFDATTMTADISLIQVEWPFDFGPAVQPLDISTSFVTVADAIVSGWGFTNFTEDMEDQLPDNIQMLKTRIITNADCEYRHSELGNVIPSDAMCTLTQEGQGWCTGAAGGSLVINNLLVGVPSWKVPCGQGFPDVYARVSSHATWILSIIDAAEPY